MSARITVAPDADGEPTLWLCVGDADPVAILSRYQLTPATRHLWPTIARRAAGRVGDRSLELLTAYNDADKAQADALMADYRQGWKP